jgi:hypothetical protein
MKILWLATVAAVLAGCGSLASQFAGEWGQSSHDRNDVTAARAGDRTTDVLPKLGKPEKIVDGENLYTGWKQWLYPIGSLLIYRGEVR